MTLVLRSSLLAEKKLDLLLKLCLQLVHLSRIVLPYRVEPVNVVEHLFTYFKKVGQSKSKAIGTEMGTKVGRIGLVSKYESLSSKYATRNWPADTYLSVQSRLRRVSLTEEGGLRGTQSKTCSEFHSISHLFSLFAPQKAVAQPDSVATRRLVLVVAETRFLACKSA